MEFAKSLALETGVLPWARRRPAAAARRGAAPELAVAVVSTRAALAELAPEWNALCAAADGPARLFLSHAWVSNWCRHYLDSAATGLAIVTARRNGRLVLVWPLVVETRLGLRTASFLGAPVSQYGDVLVAVSYTHLTLPTNREV